VLGVINGFGKLPPEMKQGVESVADSLFINTTYSFNSAVEATFRYAEDMAVKNGGRIAGRNILIKTQEPTAPALEVSFPDVVFDKKVLVTDKGSWTFSSSWKNPSSSGDNKGPVTMTAGKAGDEAAIRFKGTGISLEGKWVRDGGKADLYVDNALDRTIDTYYHFAGQEHETSIWHVLNLKDGEHTVRLVVKGDRRPESEGTNVYLISATIFRTEPKHSASYKFSFEKK